MADELLAPTTDDAAVAEAAAAPTRMRTRLARIGARPPAPTRSSSRCSASSATRTRRPTWPSSRRPTRPPRSGTATRPGSSGDPYITHPLAVTTILAELGMTPPTLCAALLHDTVEDTAYTLDQLRADFGDEIALLVDGVTKLDKVKLRRLRSGRDHPQDDRRDEQGHPGPGHQARRPAAQHAHAAVPPAGRAGADRQRDPRDLCPAGPPARHEHDQVGAGGPRRSPPCTPRSTTRSSGWSPSARRHATSSWPR